MKEKFENMLRSQSSGEAHKEDYAEDIAAIERNVDEETLEQIKELQAKKLDLVDGLRSWRKKFWAEGGDSEGKQFEEQRGAWSLEQVDENTYTTHAKGGEAFTLTKGEVMAASEWGFWWKFDDSVDSSVQKEIMSHQARSVIANEYDRQLVAMGKVDKLSNDMKRDTYAAIEAHNFSLDTMPAGILSEKMLMSFLTKAMHDSDLPFTVRSVDVYEDVEHKIDFIIEYDETTRGVEVGDPEPRHRVGIQFTTNERAVQHKNRQLDRVRKGMMNETEVDELVLIVMPFKEIRDKFKTWRYDESGGRRSERKLDPRGPDQYWDDDVKQAIINGLVKGVKGLETPEKIAA